MVKENYYETLKVSPQATQAEIKQAYRRLAKQFHPDTQKETADSDRIVEINAAYEVLGDPTRRQSYDRQISGNSAVASATAPKPPQKRRQAAPDIDAQIQLWLAQVYQPVNRLLSRILNPLESQIDELSADPFDDELLEAFQDYLHNCRNFLSEAQKIFRSMPNPSPVAGAAANLYYCLDRVGDGIDEFEFFTANYDDSYLHAGREMFRIATGLRREAQYALRNVTWRVAQVASILG